MESIKEILEFPEDRVPELEGSWGIGSIWNSGLLLRPERERVARDYIYASELGKPHVDLWLNLRATPVTNPPNARSLRKFFAGDLFEWIIWLVLTEAGIMQKSQERVEHQYEGLIKVSGRLDFVAGQHPNYEAAKAHLDLLALPPQIIDTGKRMIAFFEERYPNGVEDRVIEVKSCSAFMFERYVKSGKGGENHRKQLMHYLVGKGMRSGELIYICRDDLRMFEVPVLNPSPATDEYKAEIEKITEAMKSETQPPIAPLIVFNEDEGRFSKNWGVEYSQYLTLLYGFERPDLYAAQIAPLAAKFNRVIGRMKQGKDMTKQNLEALEEMKQYGFNPDTIAAKFAPDESESEAA